MKTRFAILFLISTSSLMAQVKSVGSHVYNWDDMPVSKLKSEERRSILQGSAVNFDYFEIYASTLNPKASQGKETNDNLEELIIVRDGNVAVTVKGESKTLGPGGVALIMAGEEHSLENVDKKTKANFYLLKFRSRAPVNAERGKNAGGSSLVTWNDIAYVGNEKGGRRQFFERPTSMLSRLEMHVTTLNQGLASHDPHTHPEEEVVILLRGQALMHIDGSEFKVSPGGLIFLDSRVPHAIKNVGNDNTACEYFAFSMRAFIPNNTSN